MPYVLCSQGPRRGGVGGMGRQRRLADELGGVVAHLQSVDGDGSMMRLLCDVACSSEPCGGRTLWASNIVSRHADCSRRVSRRGSSSGSGGIQAEGYRRRPKIRWRGVPGGHCSLGPETSLRSTLMNQSKSGFSPNVVPESGAGRRILKRLCAPSIRDRH